VSSKSQPLKKLRTESPHDPSNKCIEEDHPTLIRLHVQGAQNLSGNNWWASVNMGTFITVRAETQPDTPDAWSLINWQGVGAPGAQPNLRLFPRDAVAVNQNVSADLNSPVLDVNLNVYDLTALASDLPINQGAQRWKGYADFVLPSHTSLVTATTNPNTPDVWALLQWNTGTATAFANRKQFADTPVGDTDVRATLGQKHLNALLHMCQWPVLQVQRIRFTNGHDINRDTAGQFDREWQNGRAQNDQSRLCHTRGTTIQLTVDLNVTTAPTENETVQVRGTANFLGTQLQWTSGNIAVGPADAQVSFNATSDNPLPNLVAVYDTFRITWEMTLPDNSWRQIGTTDHVLYATLGDPNGTPAYWTLLDISCRAGNGLSDEATLVATAYVAFAGKTGDGNGFRRLRDNQELTYYLNGLNTPLQNVFTTFDLLNRPDGTGRCGAWARFFVDMCKTHGITTAQVFGVVPKVANTKLLVHNCTFNGAGSLAAPFTHVGNVECVKQNGAAGQGKTNPQFIFGDHALVEYGGRVYDPSYGTGSYPDLAAWEAPAIAGLGLGPPYVGFTQGATPQAITSQCSEGFIEHTMQPAETLAQVAALYGVASDNALYNHAYNHALRATRATIALIQAGDVVYIPRTISNVTILRRL